MPIDSVVDPIINTAAFGEQDGLEIRWWVVRDEQRAIEQAVEPYLNQPPPVDAATLERLRSAGLRLVSIPLADLGSVRSRLPIVGRIDRRWIGQAPEWIEGVAGPRFSAGRTVRINHERLTLRPGALRLLTRAWTEPDGGDSQLRIDIALQHVEADNTDARSTFMNLTGARGVLADGMVFATTLAELTADGVYFYALIPENPARRWGEDEEKATESNDDQVDPAPIGPPTPEPLEWSPEAEVESSIMQGPPAAGIPTLGEAMLMQPPNFDGVGAKRAIVVLIPRLAGDARLLP